MGYIIDPTAIVENVEMGEGSQIWKNAFVKNTDFSYSSNYKSEGFNIIPLGLLSANEFTKTSNWALKSSVVIIIRFNRYFFFVFDLLWL